MGPEAKKKVHKRTGKNFTNILKHIEPQNRRLSGYNKIAVVHSKFSRLVSSKTVYSLRYSPKTGHHNK